MRDSALQIAVITIKMFNFERMPRPWCYTYKTSKSKIAREDARCVLVRLSYRPFNDHPGFSDDRDCSLRSPRRAAFSRWAWDAEAVQVTHAEASRELVGLTGAQARNRIKL